MAFPGGGYESASSATSATMIESITAHDSDESSFGSFSRNTKSDDEDYEPTARNGTITAERFRYRIKGVKRVMKTLMKRHGGSTRHPDVSQMIHKLEKLNPTDEPAKSDLLLGEFIAHSSPDFPGRIRRRKKKGSGGEDVEEEDNDVVQYTLGRLSFGIFQPNNLVCTVRAVRNSIQVCDDSLLLAECVNRTDVKGFFYPIIIDLTIHTPCGRDLPAEMRHDALCYEIPRNDKRLGVTFLGGSLMPSHTVRSDPELLEVWKETFAHAYKTADEERSYMGRFLRLVMKWWLKMSTPTDEEAAKSELHKVHYEMKRRPKGHLDVLYLDEDLRVTRGNRGTVIVVERLPELPCVARAG